MYNIRMIPGYLTTKQAAEVVDLSRDHIRRLLEHGTVEGMKIGRDWLVNVTSLNYYMEHRPKPGPKPKRRRILNRASQRALALYVPDQIREVGLSVESMIDLDLG